MLTAERTSIVEAIYRRRAVRDFLPQPVDRRKLITLVMAGVQAPSAENRQPWAFAIVQNKALLARYCAQAKAARLATLSDAERFAYQHRWMMQDPHYNVFHNAGTLLIVYSREPDRRALEDCCFAGQNIMLAALELGLATCPIGFVRPWSDLPETKAELGVPREYTGVLPLVVGYPAATPAPPKRGVPEIFWRH